MEILGKVLPGKPQGPSWCFGKGRSGGWEHLFSFPPPPLKQLATGNLSPPPLKATGRSVSAVASTHLYESHPYESYPLTPIPRLLWDVWYTFYQPPKWLFCNSGSSIPPCLKKIFCVRFSARLSESERGCLIPGKALSGQSCDQKTDNFPPSLML